MYICFLNLHGMKKFECTILILFYNIEMLIDRVNIYYYILFWQLLSSNTNMIFIKTVYTFNLLYHILEIGINNTSKIIYKLAVLIFMSC